uniref:Uncharacterized protein n=1 Tax=Meloidogyne enterolobii TaxID=390850 RepID=A0A6V7XRZ0_MELEN|nr:unnamed protein product [Meloidogyne enterolobii]
MLIVDDVVVVDDDVAVDVVVVDDDVAVAADDVVVDDDDVAVAADDVVDDDDDVAVVDFDVVVVVFVVVDIFVYGKMDNEHVPVVLENGVPSKFFVCN